MICCGLDLKNWHDVKDGLQAALDIDCNKYTLEQIKAALDAQEMQLWAIHDGTIRAVFITQICNYPNASILDCVALSGENPQSWIGVLLNTMQDYAKENGCHYMETGGRMGWVKMFKQNGWDNFHIKMSKGIDYAK